jgi:hypothetical protein
MVLHVEAIDAIFGEACAHFIETGKYEIRQTSEGERRSFYRFQKPADENCPSIWRRRIVAPPSSRTVV